MSTNLDKIRDSYRKGYVEVRAKLPASGNVHGNEQGKSDLLCDEFMRGALEAGHTVKKSM